MDHDFYIELVAVDGLEPLKPFIGEMPFKLQLGQENVSNKPSHIDFRSMA